MIRELTPAQLRRVVDPASLEIQAAAEPRPGTGIIGQERAVRSLRFGLGMPDDGFNLYAAGPPGIGKMTAVRAFVEDIARARLSAQDWCYVNNFDDPYRPKVCRLPQGRGRELRRDMEELIEHLRREIPRVFESEDYSAKRDEIVAAFDRERAELFERLSHRAEEAGFLLESTPIGMVILPRGEKGPLREEDFEKLSDAAKQEIGRRREGVEADLKASLREVRNRSRVAKEKVLALRARIGLFLVEGLIEDLAEKYQSQPDVGAYLKSVQTDIVENIDSFRSEAPPAGDAAGVGALFMKHLGEMPFRKYQVNVLVDNGGLGGAPVVVEMNPTFSNLFGRIEKEAELGAMFTDFTMIRSGSLHRANGGFLVLPVEDVLREPLCWDGLKRALRSREIQLEELADRLGLLSTRSLRPQAIPLDLKVILVGRPMYFHLLHAYDESFPELFKVNADFDTEMEASEEARASLLGLLAELCRRERICGMDGGAAGKLLEHASRLAEDRERLSTRLGPISDVVREAHFWALEERSPVIGASHVKRALDEKFYRQGMVRERVQEMIARGFLLIDTSERAVGQVNGLSLIPMGSFTFGKPSRITASVAPGREGVVDIEREVALGGPIHSKGVFILGGFLAQRFAREHPLSLAARLVFEQTYEGVEGDSASSAELYALLSALSEIPVRQGIAVTGSVNQKGQVQAIGGVNDKIEGFFDVCRLKGLTGDQGVIIPRSNEVNLMLREDVVDAVAEGRFHVWVVETIDDGIEVLTGVPGGPRRPDGTFPEGTVNAKAAATLDRFHEVLRRQESPREREIEAAGARGRLPKSSAKRSARRPSRDGGRRGA